WSSNLGFHVAPTSVLFQTPPATPPKYQVVGSPGTPLTATTRPPRNGPICRHFMPPSNAGSMSAAAATPQQGTRTSNASSIENGWDRRVMNSFSRDWRTVAHPTLKRRPNHGRKQPDQHCWIPLAPAVTDAQPQR